MKRENFSNYQRKHQLQLIVMAYRLLLVSSGTQPTKKNVELSISDIEPIAGPSWDSCSSAGMEDSEIDMEITLEECSLAYFPGYLAKTSTEKSSCHLCKTNLIKEIDLEDKKQKLI